MGKRSNTLETTLLAIELLRRIPRHRKVSAEELQRQLEDAGFSRDLRTIQRQLEVLAAHFALERDESNRPYGYRWHRDARALSLPAMTLQESLLLRLAEEHLRNLLPVRLLKSMEGFFAQARQNLGPGGTTTLEKEWLEKVRVVPTSQPLLPPAIAPGVFETVCEALYSNLWLDIDYRNAAGQESSVEVMPLGLAQQGPRLYLVCRYKGYDNERNLALHRMRAARASTFAFERPQDFDLKKFDEEGRFGYGEGKKVRLVFRLRKSAGVHLLESPLSNDQEVRELADGYEISATVVDSVMLEWWLRHFGDAISEISREAVAE